MGSSFNTITGNTITGNNENGLYIRAGALSSTDNIIMNNTISGSDVGIYLKDSQDPGYIGIVNGNTINSNGIYDNTLGATTEGTPDGDIYSMESNYWGTTTGIDGLVSTNVDYSPWYVDAEMTTLSDVKAITAFTISEQVGTTAIDENAHAIDLIMPYGTDVTALVATFTTTGESVKVDTDTQTSETTANDFTDPVTYTVTAIDITTQDYIVTVTVLTDSQTAPDDSGEATVSSTTPEVVITNPDQGVNITIDSDTDNPTIDVSAFISDGVGTLPAIDITSLNANNTTVAISTSTTVTSADSTWNGVIAAPTITTVTLPETSGQTKTLSTAIEVGFTGAKLSFDKAVRLLLPGQAGKRAGYTRDGGTTFTEIADICGADDQATGDALASDGDCKIDATNDLDLVIWTKHFTSFATYTQVTTPPVNSGGAGGYVMLPQQTQTVAEEKVTTLAGEEKQVEVLGVELNYRETQLNKILEEAIIAYQGDVNLILNNVGHNRNMANELAGSNKYTTSLIKGSSLTLNQVYSLTNFIVYGTETTEKLGAGERAGVLNSYKTAFGKLPTTQSEWEDAIKIADGRWPSETNEKAVNSAKVEFKKVYLRDANMDNSNDNAAVTIMAYGLRSDARNLNSEKTAIKTFKAIYSYNPSSTVNWDVVRAIAYSNATR